MSLGSISQTMVSFEKRFLLLRKVRRNPKANTSFKSISYPQLVNNPYNVMMLAVFLGSIEIGKRCFQTRAASRHKSAVGIVSK